MNIEYKKDKAYKTYNPPGSTQSTRMVKKFNIEVIWDDEDGSLIRCNIPKEVMKWDWIEAADLFSDMGGWTKTQVDAIYYQLDKNKELVKKSSAFKKGSLPTLNKLKVNPVGWGQKGQE
tara:strand:+ start:129 stop:485 length:357 start_codon:yes stop_codon:yes gene_type:complete